MATPQLFINPYYMRMVGKFCITPKPKMTKIPVSFKAKFPTKGVVMIRSYDALHVFLDFNNEEDYECLLMKGKVVVADAVMKVFKWTPQFHDHQFRKTFGVMEQDNTKGDEHIGSGNECGIKEAEALPENSLIQRDVSYISDSVDRVPEVTHSDSEDRVASPVNSETSERRSSVEISCSGFSGLSSARYGIAGRIPSVAFESSSMCSTDLVPFRGTCLNHNNQKSYSRQWNYGSKSISEAAGWACETLGQPLSSLPIVEHHENQKSRLPIEVQYSASMGYPTLAFPVNHCESLVPGYKRTLIENFSYRILKMKEIRIDFRAKNLLKGQVKIRHCTSRQILFLFTNEEDYYTILYNRAFILAGSLMQISWSSPDSHHKVNQNIHPDFRFSDANPVNWNTDTSKLHPSINGLSAAQNIIARSPYDVMDYSSSMCSTYSVPPFVTDWPFGVTSLNNKNQQPPSSGWNHRSKLTSDISISCEETRSNSQAIVLSSLVQQLLKKEVVISYPSDLTEADREKPSLEMPNVSFPTRSPPRSIGSVIQAMSKLKVLDDPNSVNRSVSDSSKPTQQSATMVNSAETAVLLNADPHKGIKPKAMEKPSVQSVSITAKNFQSHQVTAPATDEKPQVPAISQCLSAPSVPPPSPLLGHSASIAALIFGRNEQAGRESTFPSPSKALDQHSLAQQHNQLNSYKEQNMTVGIAQLQPQSTTSVSETTISVRYRECLKNHAASMGGHAVDGYGEFMPSGRIGTPEALKCAACSCHRNFHRKEIHDHPQIANVGSHSTFSPPRNISSSDSIQNQAPISAPTRQLHHHHHSLVDSSPYYSQPPSPKSGPVFSQQGLERIEPSFILPSYSYEMVNHDTVQNGQQREYS
ncbi:hypothetical protein P3S67_001822 [Capsicum chacoense]